MSLFSEIAESVSAKAVAAVTSALTGSASVGESATAASTLLGSSRSTASTPRSTSVASGADALRAFQNTDNLLFGGITPREAREMVTSMLAEQFARKNLFLVEVTSNLGGGTLNMPSRFNMFVTDIEYSPFILQGEKVPIGGAQADTMTGNDPVELQITTMDDRQGTLKRWFAAHARAAAARDGTVSEPGKYAIRIAIAHSFIESSRASAGNAFEVIGLFRPATLAVSLSRRDDALEELQMTFSQLDTFMRP